MRPIVTVSRELNELRERFEPPLKGWGNDDLLYSVDAREIAKRDDPAAYEVLYWPEFHNAFREFETSANEAKKRHRRIGVAAALLAAIGAAGLPLVTQFAPQEDWAKWALGALVFSILGVLFGVCHYVLHRGGRRWLGNRMVAERLRHFYFHNLLENFALAAQTIADESLLKAWRTANAAALDRVKRLLEEHRDNHWKQMSNDRRLNWVWISPNEGMNWEQARANALASLPDLGEKAQALLERLYYQRLKIQVKYASKATRFSIGSFGFWARASYWVSNFSLLGVPVLIVIASGTLLLGPTRSPLEPNPAMLYLTFAAALASIGLAAKAFDRGLRAQADVDRTNEYSEAINVLQEKYLQEASSPQEKLMILFDLEREAYWETREFFLNHKRDSFLG